MVLDRYQDIIKGHAENFKEIFGSKFIYGNYKRNVKDKSRYRSDFPLFNIASDNFYIYQIYVEDLQSNIRNYLINPILEELLKEYGYDIEQYNLSPFPFIFKGNDTRIGVRYTKFLYATEDEKELIKKSIKDFQVDKVINLHFSDDKEFGLNRYCEAVNICDYSIKMFLDEFINENLYQYFFTTLTTVIDEMQELIAFEVIPRLNMSNLAKARLELRENLRVMDFHELSYDLQNKCNNLEKSDLDIICSNIEKGKVQVLLGKTDFAKSYLTSEYLYKAIVDNSNFDYTSVVAGYLKTIEQFLYRLLEYHMDIDGSEKWIKVTKYMAKGKERRPNPKYPNDRNKQQILVKWHNLEYMDTSLGPLINYIDENEDCCEISKDGKTILTDLLNDYRKSVRNGYFHKHNLEDIEEVRRIRNNTLYLLCFLIGSLKDFDITKFGYLDFSFNDFYHAVPRFSINIPFYIQETKNSQPKLMKQVFEQEAERYDLDGLLENNLYFAEVVDPKKKYKYIADVPKNDLVIFNTNNVPYRAEYIRGSIDDGLDIKVEFYKQE